MSALCAALRSWTRLLRCLESPLGVFSRQNNKNASKFIQLLKDKVSRRLLQKDIQVYKPIESTNLLILHLLPATTAPATTTTPVFYKCKK